MAINSGYGYKRSYGLRLGNRYRWEEKLDFGIPEPGRPPPTASTSFVFGGWRFRFRSWPFMCWRPRKNPVHNPFLTARKCSFFPFSLLRDSSAGLGINEDGVEKRKEADCAEIGSRELGGGGENMRIDRPSSVSRLRLAPGCWHSKGLCSVSVNYTSRHDDNGSSSSFRAREYRR